MTKFTVETGKTYQADIHLGGFESFAGNDLVASKFAELGFVNITVTGSGGERVAVGKWTGNSATVELPEQVINPHEVDPVEVKVADTPVVEAEGDFQVAEETKTPNDIIKDSLS
jgi:hypothetical protein